MTTQAIKHSIKHPAPYTVRHGRRNPLGATPVASGVNFATFSRHAETVELLLFERADSREPFQVIHLDAEINRTFFVWHVYVEGLKPGTWYNWRMDGPNDTEHSGLSFDREKHLLDPWARAVHTSLWDRAKACQPGDNGNAAMRGLVVADDDYDWEDDQPLVIPSERMVIYEMHVGGFTRHPESGVKHPGTFSGVIEKIPYLQDLGITHVELLPIMAFDEQDVPEKTARLGLKNYWGYSTHSFYSPHPGYCISPEEGTHVREFRDLVKALHKAGIGVILDVVFNHTAEGGEGGPFISFKGMGRSIFYHLAPTDMRIFHDYTGCGNTLNANHPIVANFIIECLEYWVQKMHVDGFRFDLASALARGEDGNPMHDAPVLWGIELSERLSDSKLIAEAWDAAGLYQVGSFPGYRWSEWNGRYRDVVRRFIGGEKGLIGELATRICGSSDFYRSQHRLPTNSVNFVTCHDGHSLIDLLSYEHKHNQANGEENQDGCNNNLSTNCGIEGQTKDLAIQTLRVQHAKNYLSILLLSQGVPMLLSGDEILRSQQGNNNTYCQDNELSWFDWSQVRTNGYMHRFVRLMIALRKRHPCLRRRRFINGTLREGHQVPDIMWHGERLNEPDWDGDRAQCLAFTLGTVTGDAFALHVILNMSGKRLHMELPEVETGAWQLAVDTALKSPREIVSPEKQRPVKSSSYPVKPHSVIVLEFNPKAKAPSERPRVGSLWGKRPATRSSS